MAQKLRCPNKECGWVWNYRGKKVYPAYATCPNCLYKVKIPKQEEQIMAKWICRKCGKKTETYKDSRGEWFSCSNEECETYNRMRREEDGDFLEYFKEV